MEEFWKKFKRSFDRKKIVRTLSVPPIFVAWYLVFVVPLSEAFPVDKVTTQISGYVKSFNFVTRTSGFVPELVDPPFALGEENETVFSSLERLRLKLRMMYQIDEGSTFFTNLEYDHQANFGSFVGTGDMRLARKQAHDRQFLDLSQSFVESEHGIYEQRLYRGTIGYANEKVRVEVGRQLIPWGLGHFFTPTDLFSPFNPTQLELDERDGVDAVNVIIKSIKGVKGQFVYTPGGRQLHPQRYLVRLSRDVKQYEVGVLGGRVKRDHVIGFDLQGNVKDSGLRGEFLFREAATEKDFVKFVINMDHNFSNNIYALAEYYFNGQGRRDSDDYQIDRWVRGEIQQLGKNFAGVMLGYDVTPLWRLEQRTIYNLDDTSFFVRPEMQFEATSNLLFTAGAQLYLGESDDEFGEPSHLYLSEVKFSF